MLRISAVAYQMVNRPRILSTLGANHVAHAAHRVNQLGFPGVIDLLPQSCDHHVYDVRAGIEVVVPGVFGDQCPRHHTALMPHEVLEHRVLLRRQLDALAVARDLPAAGVQHQTIHLERRRRDRLGSSPECFHPRQQFLEGEGLRDVVVRAHAQRLYFEIDGVLRGEHQHGQSNAAVAQGAQDVDPRELRQTQVQNHDVVIRAAAPPARAAQSLVAVADEIDVISGLIEPASHVFAYGFVVFDDENLHPIGRKTLKFVPTPIVDSTSIRPRCSSTMPYATDNPRPVPRPCGLVVKNGSKILGKSSCRIPVPVSMNSARISSRRCGLRCVHTVSTPREFIASMALSISAMKHWTSRSASAGNAGSPASSWRSIVSHLKRSWCFRRNSVCSMMALMSADALLPDFLGRENSSRPSTMRRHRCTSVSTIWRYSCCACRSFSGKSSTRSANASLQARIVASGLLISCMTPAASWPIAASFSLCARRCCACRQAVTSSPIVMTCEMSSSSRRIGIFVMR